MKCYLYECHHEQAGTWGMWLPWNVKPEWPGVTVRRILSTTNESRVEAAHYNVSTRQLV